MKSEQYESSVSFVILCINELPVRGLTSKMLCAF